MDENNLRDNDPYERRNLQTNQSSYANKHYSELKEQIGVPKLKPDR